jgi:CO/xanthine dehydrogenase FAD-binding subunit
MENKNDLGKEVRQMPVFYRRLPQFQYVSPKTIEEAILFLESHIGEAKPMAGGTDLIPNLKRRELISPTYVVDLKELSELKEITCDMQQGIQIGALATIRDIGRHPTIGKLYPSLAQAASCMASPQVRNRGTFVGNICSAVPSADSAPPLLSLNANVSLRGSKGERIIPLDRFFVAPGETVLRPDEIVTALILPGPADRSVYLKLSPRHSMDMAIVGVAAAANLAPGGLCDIRIALGAVAPTPIRAVKAEAILQDQPVSQTLIEEAAHAASIECQPIDDYRASAAYRRDMVYVLTRRALNQVLAV